MNPKLAAPLLSLMLFCGCGSPPSEIAAGLVDRICKLVVVNFGDDVERRHGEFLYSDLHAR